MKRYRRGGPLIGHGFKRFGHYRLVLRQAGLVEVRGDAQRRVYRLRPEPLREIDDWLEPYRAAWRHRLDALEHHLDEMADEGDEHGRR